MAPYATKLVFVHAVGRNDEWDNELVSTNARFFQLIVYIRNNKNGRITINRSEENKCFVTNCKKNKINRQFLWLTKFFLFWPINRIFFWDYEYNTN